MVPEGDSEMDFEIQSISKYWPTEWDQRRRECGVSLSSVLHFLWASRQPHSLQAELFLVFPLLESPVPPFSILFLSQRVCCPSCRPTAAGSASPAAALSSAHHVLGTPRGRSLMSSPS